MDKGQGFHSFSIGADGAILVIGIVLGLVAIYMLKDVSFVQNFICSAPPVA